MGYAFLSYSTKNQGVADAIRDLLNKNNIATWMAPGDIPAGSKYAMVINQAIKDCSCFLLILSNDSQKSVWVAKETERAISYGKIIIPVQIEQVVLNDEFEFYISSNQITAIQKIDERSEEVKKLLADVYSAANQTEGDSNNKNEGERDSKSKYETKETGRQTDHFADVYSKQRSEGISYTAGTYPFYKDGRKKEILWDVLASAENKILLISKFGLDACFFSKERNKTWDTCSLRKWLNEDFYDEAFSDHEKEAILETKVLPDPNMDYSTYAGEPCTDKLFILSRNETLQYFPNIEDMCCKPTEYARWKGAFSWGNGCCLWWLRTPGNKNNMMTYVNAGGGSSEGGCYAQRSEVCVRPAMWVDLSLLK